MTQTDNGVIAPGGTTSYAAGSTPSFTITPDTGYHIASINTNAGSQTVTTPAGQTYTFPALSADGTITATYAANSGTLGNTATGSNSYSSNIEDGMAGIVITTPSNPVTVQSISAYVHVSGTTFAMKAAIYTTGGALVGTAGTQEVSVTTSTDDQFVLFTYAAGNRPTLTANTQYVLVVWSDEHGGSSNNQAYLYGSSNSGTGRTEGENYVSSFPSSIGSWDATNTINYSIYATY